MFHRKEDDKTGPSNTRQGDRERETQRQERQREGQVRSAYSEAREHFEQIGASGEEINEPPPKYEVNPRPGPQTRSETRPGKLEWSKTMEEGIVQVLSPTEPSAPSAAKKLFYWY